MALAGVLFNTVGLINPTLADRAIYKWTSTATVK